MISRVSEDDVYMKSNLTKSEKFLKNLLTTCGFLISTTLNSNKQTEQFQMQFSSLFVLNTFDIKCKYKYQLECTTDTCYHSTCQAERKDGNVKARLNYQQDLVLKVDR